MRVSRSVGSVLCFVRRSTRTDMFSKTVRSTPQYPLDSNGQANSLLRTPVRGTGGTWAAVRGVLRGLFSALAVLCRYFVVMTTGVRGSLLTYLPSRDVLWGAAYLFSPRSAFQRRGSELSCGRLSSQFVLSHRGRSRPRRPVQRRCGDIRLSRSQ